MSLTAAIDAIAVRIEEVPDSGRVHRFERLIKDWPKFIEECRVPVLNKARWWIVTRVSRIGTQDSAGIRRDQSIAIRGHEPIVDSVESERAFQLLADLVCDAFEPSSRLADRKKLRLAPGFFLDGVPTMTVDIRNVGGVDVHFCEIIVPVVQRDGFCNV